MRAARAFLRLSTAIARDYGPTYPGPMTQTPEELYRSLRTRAIEDSPGLIADPGPEHPGVIGAVVDIPSEGGSATVVALADGTTSMYTSTGGGVIGGGGHARVVAATHALLAVVQSMLTMLPADDRTDLPPQDLVMLTVLTPDGRRRAGLPVEAFWGREPSTVAPLLGAIHAVISALREITPTGGRPPAEG